MRFRRWRLATLMGLVAVVAVGVKGVLLTLPKHDIVRDYLAAGYSLEPRPWSPEVEQQLVALLDDPEARVRWYALVWLDGMGSTNPALIPKLVDRLLSETTEDWHQQRRDPDQIDPARSLIRFQLPAAVVAPLLRPALVASVDNLPRVRAITVLADAAQRAGTPSDPALATLLLGALDDARPVNRLLAAEGLARLDGVIRQRAVAALLRQVQAPDRPMRLVAAANLARFDPEAGLVAAVIADRMDRTTDDPRARVEDLYLLGRIGSPARPAVAAIVRAMTAPNSPRCSFPLQGFGPKPGAGYSFDNIGVYLPGDTSSQFSGRAGAMGAVALGRIGRDAECEAVALLVALLQGPDEGRQFEAAVALGDLGLKARSAFPALLAFIEQTTRPPPTGGDWILSARPTRALSQLVEPTDPALADALIRLLTSASGPRRGDAVVVLGQIRPPIAAAVPALIAALRDDVQGVRCGAARALGRFTGPEREAAVPALIAALGDPDEFARLSAAEALAHLGTGAEQAVPVLVATLEGGRPNLRWFAAQLIGRFGPAARSAVPVLRRYQSDPDRAVREAVAPALDAIGPVESTRPAG